MNWRDRLARLIAWVRALPPRRQALLGGGTVVAIGLAWWSLSPPSLEAQLLAAERAHYPHGRWQVVAGLADPSGSLYGARRTIRYPLRAGQSAVMASPYDERDWFPATGITAPDAHAFVFSAWPADQPLPALEQDLTARGVLRRVDVPMTRDERIDGKRHIAVEPFVFYLTKPWDPRFLMETAWLPIYPLMGIGTQTTDAISIPSRLDDRPIPDDPDYIVPTQLQWATTRVRSFQALDTPVSATIASPPTRNDDGTVTVTALIGMRRAIPDWMRTVLFKTQMGAPQTIDPTRIYHITTEFRIQDGKPVWFQDFGWTITGLPQ